MAEAGREVAPQFAVAEINDVIVDLQRVALDVATAGGDALARRDELTVLAGRLHDLAEST